MRIHHSKYQDLDWRSFGAIDTMITDPPFSPRTEIGMETGRIDGRASTSCDYGSITVQDADELASVFAPLIASWVVIFADHIAWDWHRAAWEARGWYTFAPIPYVKTNGSPRFAADGPASVTEWILMARPRKRPKVMKSRRGWYQCAKGSHERGRRRAGHKPALLLQQIVADYSEPGDLIVDPFAGTATVGAAAIAGGRRYIGSEVDAQAHALARERIDRIEPHIPGLFAGEQGEIMTGEDHGI
jgi:site-specific DNA-methyltransferase (adenine-specific)